MTAAATVALLSTGGVRATQPRPQVVCGAWFKALPSTWEQSGSLSALVIDGAVPSGPTTWAVTPRAEFDLARPLPREGIDIWIDLQRPKNGPSGPALRLPLRLSRATVVEQKGAVPGLPEYVLYGRYRHQYDARVAVDFGRAPPPPGRRRLADRILRRVVFPRWVPFTGHSSCRANR